MVSFVSEDGELLVRYRFEKSPEKARARLDAAEEVRTKSCTGNWFRFSGWRGPILVVVSRVFIFLGTAPILNSF